MTYNLTAISQNQTSYLDFIVGVNDVLLFNWLGALLLIGISFVLFIAFMQKTDDVKMAMVGTSFIAFTLAISLRALNLLPNLGLYITLILLAGSLAFSFKRD